jgi:hypothetical protein
VFALATPKSPIDRGIRLLHNLWQTAAQDFDADNVFGDEPGGNEGAEGGVEVLEGVQPGAGDRPRITTRYMTKYERARVLGTRALQIRQAASAGWQPFGSLR